MVKPTRIVPIDVCYLLVEFPEEISPQVNRSVRALWYKLGEQALSGILSMVPTYRSLLIHYDPEVLKSEKLQRLVVDLADQLQEEETLPGRVVTLPVLYGGKQGPDLAAVAQHNKLTEDEVVAIHTEGEYLVYMLGFAPGFPYLGGLDPRLHTPRLEVPRTRVRAGSVGIAGQQTGVYSTNSPGGWQLIGHTPVPLFSPYAKDPVLLRPGDIVKFRAVEEQEYLAIKQQVESGSYQVEVFTGGRVNE